LNYTLSYAKLLRVSRRSFQQRVFQKEGFAHEQSYHQEREETWHTLRLASFIRDIINPQACFGGQVHASETGHQTFTCRKSAGSESCKGGGRKAQVKAASGRKTWYRQSSSEIQEANKSEPPFRHSSQKGRRARSQGEADTSQKTAGS
jgi:hypothetical protein